MRVLHGGCVAAHGCDFGLPITSSTYSAAPTPSIVPTQTSTFTASTWTNVGSQAAWVVIRVDNSQRAGAPEEISPITQIKALHFGAWDHGGLEEPALRWRSYRVGERVAAEAPGPVGGRVTDGLQRWTRGYAVRDEVGR